MSAIRSAHVVLFYLFDVAESLDLSAVPTLIGGPTVAAKFTPKPPTPAYMQYDKPPLSFDGELLDAGTVDDFSVRFRAYDYGVLSLALSRQVAGSWADLVTLGQTLIENEALELKAEQLVARAVERLRPALLDHRDTHLREDYLVFVVHELDVPKTAEQVLAEHGTEIAAMLRGERQPLSPREREAVLRHSVSYMDNDLVVPTWNAALVYDTPAGSQAALEILELANSQLLQFRYYDERLDNELESIYASVQRPRWYDQWIGSRHTRAVRHVHALFIDVTEITGRTVNAMKFMGDIYAARLFSLVGERLGLNSWKADIERKLKTLDDIHRFAVEHSSVARANLLELIIVLILVFELVRPLLGALK